MYPILSIIIPVYNTEKYLTKCLNSIVNQTFSNIEIICVNDGSSDGSLKILEKYEKTDQRVKVIDKQNGGLSSARNIGIEHAQGQYITFVDSDDFIELDAYEKTLSYFNIPEVDLVYFSTRLIIEDGVNRVQDQQYFEHKYRGLAKLTHDVIVKMDVCAWNKIYKLSIIRKYDIKFPVGLWYEDNPFFWSYSLVCNSVYFVNDRLYNYLIRNGSIMSYINRKSKVDKKIFHELDSLLGFEYLLHFVFKWNLIEIFKPALVGLLIDKIYESLYCLPKKDRMLVLNKATEIINLFNLKSYYPDNDYIVSLSKRHYYKIGKINQLFLTKKQRLFGIWNADIYYIICFLGFRLKIRKTQKT